MSRFFELRQGDSVVVVEATSEGATRPLGHLDDIVAKVDRSLDDLLGKSVRAHCAVVTSVLQQLEKQSQAPSSATVEFGLQLNGEGALYVVRSSVQASYKITLKWDRREARDQ